MKRSSSPSPTPPACWPMEPTDPATSLWGHREIPYAIYSLGPCPYPVAQMQPMLSSPGMREGEEGVTDEEDVVEVAIANEEDGVVMAAVINKDDDPVKVIPVPNSTPPRPAYKQTVRIRISPRGRPTRTRAPRMDVREANPESSKTGSGMWPPPPPAPTATPHR
jgi:hypothetical protein